MTKRVHEPLIHLTRRLNVDPKYAWGVRIAMFVAALLTCAIISVLMVQELSFGNFFAFFFKGALGTKELAWQFFRDMAIMLLLALAVTPCFIMRYWNIGGEGQTMAGALGSALIVWQLTGKVDTGWMILICLLVSIGFAITVAVIPALLKAKWNTNETLLTLMFNYIVLIVGHYLVHRATRGEKSVLLFPDLKFGSIAGNEYLLIILIAIVATIFMAVYLKYSKHGYELKVAGESPNTARYVGIHNKAVIIRTLVLCGAIGGLVGFLLVCANAHSFTSDDIAKSTLGGKAFTAVLVSWLGHFNPLAMALTSFLVVLVTRGATNIGTERALGTNYPAMMTGIFLFFIIATEFFVNFKVSFRHKQEIAREPDDLPDVPTPPAEQAGKTA